MVAREDAQMVTRLVAQPVMVVCVEPHKYGGATVIEIRDLGKNAASFSACSSYFTHSSKHREGILIIYILSHRETKTKCVTFFCYFCLESVFCVSTYLLGFGTLKVLRF